MDKEVIKIIEELSKDHPDILNYHIKIVAKYCKQFAKIYKANLEVVELAAWLHDIAKLRGMREGHHIAGAEESEQILRKLGYSEDIIKQVKECVLCHSSDEKYPRVTLEANVVANADSLAHFDNFIGLCQAAFCGRKLGREEARQWLLGKFERSWKKLTLPEAQKIVKPKLEMIKEISRKPNKLPTSKCLNQLRDQLAL